MDWSGFHIVQKHSAECDKCGWTGWNLVRTQDSAARPQYRYACQGCERLAAKYVSQKAIEQAGYNLADIPYHHVSRDFKYCEVCGSKGAELHHWAPWAYFGIEAENWPTANLCQRCHVRWHRLVTPNIAQSK